MKDKVRRIASDNEYLHKDFHMALNNGLEYLEKKYGSDAVTEYISDFAKAYHAPLKADLQKRGLPAVRDYLEKIYAAEKNPILITISEDELIAETDKCPAVEHIIKNGSKPHPLYSETANTKYTEICRNTSYAFELLEYDSETGRSKMRFYRRQA